MTSCQDWMSDPVVLHSIIEINQQLDYSKAIFRLGFDLEASSISIIPASDVWLSEFAGCIINTSREFHNMLINHFDSKGYKLTFNIDGSRFWLSRKNDEEVKSEAS